MIASRHDVTLLEQSPMRGGPRPGSGPAGIHFPVDDGRLSTTLIRRRILSLTFSRLERA